MKRYLLSSACVLFSYSAPLQAQALSPTVEADDVTADEIVVTASRRAQSIQDVPIAVTAISGDAIENAAIHDTQSLQLLAPGLVVTSSASEATATQIRLRGVGTSGSNLGLEGSVGVFVDGVYRARPGIALSELVDVDRVEVLRGPQGTAYGKNTTAGAVLIQTRRPGSEWSGEASASYGNRDAYRLTAALGGPLAGENLAFRVAGVYNKRDGYLQDATLGRDLNDRDRFLLRGQLLATPTPDVTLRLIADYSEKNEACCAATVIQNGSRAPAIAALGGFVPTNFRDYVASNNVPFLAATKEWGVSGQADVDLGSVDWLTIVSYRDFTSDRRGDTDYTNLDIIRVPFEDTEDRFFTAETTLRGNAGPLDWMVGGFYFDQKTDQAGAISFGTDAFRFFQRLFPAANLTADLYPVGGGDTRTFTQDADGWSLFTHNIVEVLPRVKVTLGARYLEETKNGTGTFTFNSPVCSRAGVPAGARQLCPVPNFDADFTDEKVIGTASIAYELAGDGLLYASYSKGYKAGGINLDRTAGVAGAVQTFEPELVDSYELGLKLETLDGRANFNLTGFYSDYTDFQQNAFTGTSFVISNAAQVTSKGVELEAALRPADWLQVDAAVVYNSAKYGSATADAGVRGRQIVNAPKWTYQTSFTAERPIGQQGLSGFASANLRAISDLNTSASLNPQAEQDGYILVGGRVGMRGEDDRWELSLFATNLFDTYYRTIVFAGVLQPGTFNAHVGEPRTYGIEARVRF